MNLAEELFATEGCILELEDSTTEGNNDTTRRRTMALVAIFRASLHSSPQERIALQYLQGKVNYQERLIQSTKQASDLSLKELNICIMIVSAASPYMSLPRC
ncbi:hypothetical protein A0J61_04503 [Choanephora cucurbitarum]|uniref:Uncharacterized protein n=1 Tax=Choanephora cucurbitarum TaxID=101091 RepID=A0A1C7NEC3_9FUNG|nr:hypothetical protein A0J61_04503 [Choanephora cucurbitarum]